MDDKLVAGVLTALGVGSICALCVLGPVVIASAVASVSGWLSGLGAVNVVGLAIIAAILVYGLRRRVLARGSRTAHR